MPELPEVETVRRQLQEALPGRTIIDVSFSDGRPHILRRIAEPDFIEAVRGARILAVRRSGKWLIVDLDNNRFLVAHLRMTGRWFLRHKGAPDDAYMRSKITLDNEDELRWCDVRKFGTWDLTDEVRNVTGISGPEPLSDAFTAVRLIAEAKGRRAPIKAFLLDQRRVAGLGNIYADEALWHACLHPLREAGSLTMAEAVTLREAIVQVLLESLESGGSSMRDYLDSNGRRGAFQERWRVYKHEGSPCYRCGAEIRKLKVAGRGSRYCPNCQQLRDETARTPNGSEPDSARVSTGDR
jgi:formamidopyrimidine-DNA glycosylase